MPKITVAGGPTDANAEPGQAGYIDAYLERDGGQQSSAGKSSSTSGKSPQTMPGMTGTAFQKLAPETDSPSGRDPAESSNAPSTGGSTPETTSAPSKNASKAKWVEFLVTQEYDKADLEAMTRDELVEFWESEE